MSLTAIFISLGVILLTPQDVSSTFCSVTRFSSPVSDYTKLTETLNRGYSYWVSRCQGQLFLDFMKIVHVHIFFLV